MRRLIAPFLRFVQLESASSIVLLMASLVALVLANSALAPLYESLLRFPVGGTIGSFTFQWNLHEWINDVLMAIFFLLMGLEIKRELIKGELASLRRALLPVLAALGGVLTPALIYWVWNRGSENAHGWGIPIATDIAFSLAALSLFGRRIPLGLKVFLVTLAIVDDIAGVLVIATAYTRHLHYAYLLGAMLLFGLCLLMNRAGVIRLSAYLAVGLLLWCALHASGIHATLAGVLLAFAMPAQGILPADTLLERGRQRLDQFAVSVERAGPSSREARRHLHRLRAGIERYESPLDRLERVLHPWVSFGIVPLFAFANAGIPVKELSGGAALDPVFLGIFLGLVLGKPIGITLFSWVAVRLGVAELPYGVSWRQLHAAAWLGGIGFTVSIFIAGLAFNTEDQYALARLAVFAASTVAALVGICLLAAFSQTSVPEQLEEQVSPVNY
jgi:NhaA family Na+:H+ antiporter